VHRRQREIIIHAFVIPRRRNFSRA
jgi:hypothetical protein